MILTRTEQELEQERNGHLQHATCNIDAPVHTSQIIPWAPRTETRNDTLAGVYLIPRQGFNRRRDGSRLGACVQGSALCRRILVFLYSGIVITVSFVGWQIYCNTGKGGVDLSLCVLDNGKLTAHRIGLRSNVQSSGCLCSQFNFRLWSKLNFFKKFVIDIYIIRLPMAKKKRIEI